jgi:hypothetical protein
VRQWLEATADAMQPVESRERYWEATLRYAGQRAHYALVWYVHHLA